MNDLDLKEIIWMIKRRLQEIEAYLKIKGLAEDYDWHRRSDKYIQDVLDSIKEGE